MRKVHGAGARRNLTAPPQPDSLPRHPVQASLGGYVLRRWKSVQVKEAIGHLQSVQAQKSTRVISYRETRPEDSRRKSALTTNIPDLINIQFLLPNKGDHCPRPGPGGCSHPLPEPMPSSKRRKLQGLPNVHNLRPQEENTIPDLLL